MSVQLRGASDGTAVRLAGKKERARAACEAGIGRPLSDAEWEEARTRFINFTKILRDWEKHDTSAR
jgi:hypothetical protein